MVNSFLSEWGLPILITAAIVAVVWALVWAGEAIYKDEF